MKFVNYLLVPFLIISLILCILNYGSDELEDYSFTDILIRFNNYVDNSTLDFLDRVKDDLRLLSSAADKNPLYDDYEVTSQPNINDYFNDHTLGNSSNIFEAFKKLISQSFQVIRDTFYYKTGNESAILSFFNSLSYYFSYGFNTLYALFSLLIDTIGLSLQFLFFTFDVFFI